MMLPAMGSKITIRLSVTLLTNTNAHQWLTKDQHLVLCFKALICVFTPIMHIRDFIGEQTVDVRVGLDELLYPVNSKTLFFLEFDAGLLLFDDDLLCAWITALLCPLEEHVCLTLSKLLER